MPTIDQYGEPTPGGFGPGNLLGLAASASAADYFLLRARSFSNIATGGIPQGIFGLRAVGRKMTSLSSSALGNVSPEGRFFMARYDALNNMGKVGGFLSGQGVPFGRFNNVTIQNASGRLGMMFSQNQVKKIRNIIGRTSTKDLLFGSGNKTAREIIKNTGMLKNVDAAVVSEVQRKFVLSSRLAGIGKVMGGVLPVVRAALAAKLAIDLAGFAGKVVGSAIGAVTRGVGPTMTSYRGLEFGGPTQVFQMGTAVTERQRALAEIQRSHSNSRFLFGNEAAMYSQS